MLLGVIRVCPTVRGNLLHLPPSLAAEAGGAPTVTPGRCVKELCTLLWSVRGRTQLQPCDRSESASADGWTACVATRVVHESLFAEGACPRATLSCPGRSPPEPLVVKLVCCGAQLPEASILRLFFTKFPHQVVCHVWSPVTDHVQCVCPGRPVCSWSTPHGRAQLQPSHPHWEGCQLLTLFFWKDVQQCLGCVPNALVMRVAVFVLGLALWSSVCHAHCKSGAVGIASQRALSLARRSSNFSEMYRSDPMGVPNTVIPLGCHTSGPKSSTFCGGTRVFPWCNGIPATLNEVVASKSYRTLTRDGSHKTYRSFRNAHNCSPGRRAAATSSLDANGKQERHQRVSLLAALCLRHLS